jgi:ribosome-associated heat shock protein Hsp15
MASTPEKDRCRADQWLWSVRVFKSRTLASEACRSGKVKIGGHAIKASRLLSPGETLTVRKGMVTHTYQVLQTLEKRVGAALVEQYMKDLTPQEELDKLLPLKAVPVALRLRGTGRPTKKERRDMDEWRETD